jgi:hypothetical protein
VNRQGLVLRMAILGLHSINILSMFKFRIKFNRNSECFISAIIPHFGIQQVTGHLFVYMDLRLDC